MPFYADLHVHSKYSRATSKDADLEGLATWAQRKGIAVVGTGDFTHPAWFAELREKLEPAEPGLFRLRPEIERAVEERVPASCRRPVRFMLEVEISTIYKKGERTRKIHHLIYAPDLDTASRFRDRLARIGNIESDGRPILGLDSRDLLEVTLESGPDAYLVPAHIWTPWFAVLGSKTVEFFPEEGKYHLDGHRSCGVRLTPEETRRHDGACPQCGKPVTVGVLSRVDELADRAEGEAADGRDPFRRLGPELSLLEALPREEVERSGDPRGGLRRRVRHHPPVRAGGARSAGVPVALRHGSGAGNSLSRAQGSRSRFGHRSAGGHRSPQGEWSAGRFRW